MVGDTRVLIPAVWVLVGVTMALAVMGAVAAALVAAGVLGYRRRDIG